MKKNRLLIALVAGSFVLGAFTSRQLFRTITADDVRKAANIMGLEFTQNEIDSLLPGIEEYREDYAANREIETPNDLGLPLYFNPLRPDQSPQFRNINIAYRNPGPIKLPENRDELAYYSIPELAALIRTKQITSVELTQFFIERLKKYDPALHCVVTLTEELALEQARKADAELAEDRYLGMLHGIPYGLKDLFATEKYKTTWGAKPYRNQQIDYNATVVERLEKAGAVMVAKLSLGALAWGDVWYGGQTRNPWAPDEGSSGSSAGSAAAVAAGLVPFAIGTETLGSIVSPSTVCGVTGLRPTFGRVSRYGAMTLSWSMDKVGPICRDAEDCAIVLRAIIGPDGKDRSVVDYPFNYSGRINPRNLKVGYLKAAFEEDYPFKTQDSLTLAALERAGYELTPVELPPMPDIRFILDAEAAAAFDELTRSGRDDELTRQIRNAWPNVFRKARFIPAVEYIQANRLRMQLMQQMENTFADVDVFLHPSWNGPTLTMTNFTGHPTLVMPNGMREGRPTSISLTAPLYKEENALVIGNVIEELLYAIPRGERRKMEEKLLND